MMERGRLARQRERAGTPAFPAIFKGITHERRPFTSGGMKISPPSRQARQVCLLICRFVDFVFSKGVFMDRKYEFSWELLGDLALGRPNLGPMTRLEVYRLMQFCFRDVIESQFGSTKADEIFYAAGKLAGQHFYRNVLQPTNDFDNFVQQLQEALRELGIGILRIEKSDAINGKFVLTVSEDLDCSGLPELDYEICTYDEGFIAALLESFTGLAFLVKEIDCWCTGDRTCRFTADVVKA